MGVTRRRDHSLIRGEPLGGSLADDFGKAATGIETSRSPSLDEPERVGALERLVY